MDRTRGTTHRMSTYMAKKERTRNLVVRLSHEEIAKMHALANDRDAAIADLVRAFIVDAYAERFGKRRPPEPKLKFAPRTQVRATP